MGIQFVSRKFRFVITSKCFHWKSCRTASSCWGGVLGLRMRKGESKWLYIIIIMNVASSHRCHLHSHRYHRQHHQHQHNPPHHHPNHDRRVYQGCTAASRPKDNGSTRRSTTTAEQTFAQVGQGPQYDSESKWGTRLARV